MLQIEIEKRLAFLETQLERKITKAVEPITVRINNLEAPALTSANYFSSPNYLPNSHPEWSNMAYGTVGTTPTTVGDTNRECFGWYRHPFIRVTDLTTSSGSPTVNSAANPFSAARFTGTVQFMLFAGGASGATLTGTLTRVNDGQATMSVNAGATLTAGTMYFGDNLANSAAFALKRSVSGAEHSLWAANEAVNNDIPIWDGVAGNFLLGSISTNYTIDALLPTDFVYPGQTYYVSFEVSLATAVTEKGTDQQFFCGFWDDTSGQQKWLEGSSFTPTATVFGVAGSRTLNYKILARTDSDTEILSTTVVVTTAPATMSENNHVRLSFTGAPGFIYYGIYRQDGSNYRLVHEIRNSIDLQFFDMQENAGSPQTGFPTITTATPKAYAITDTFEPGDLASTAFSVHTATIKVPSTYNRSNTTGGNQWFRWGLDELLGSGNEREIVIRRISVSEGFGGTWTRSPRDMAAASAPTATAASAPSTGTTYGDPPGGGSGGEQCVAVNTLIDAINPQTYEQYQVSPQDLKNKWTICGALALPVRNVEIGTVQETIELVTANGLKLQCTESHRLVVSWFDKTGKSAKFLDVGDTVMTCINGQFAQSEIMSKKIILGECDVAKITLPAPHKFITNGFVSHNTKNLP